MAGPTISGRKSPTWRTIERLAQAVGGQIDVRVQHPGARMLLDEWRYLLRRPIDRLLPVLSDPAPWARDLRHGSRCRCLTVAL